MKDERKYKRRHLIFYLRVFERGSGRLLGFLTDITPEGLMLISEEPLETDRDFQMSMHLPEEIGGKSEISFDARGVWCRKDVNPDFHATGLTIISIAPEELRLMGRLVREFGFND